MQLNVEPVYTKQFIVLSKIVALIKLLSKDDDAKIVVFFFFFFFFFLKGLFLKMLTYFLQLFCSFCCFDNFV